MGKIEGKGKGKNLGQNMGEMGQGQKRGQNHKLLECLVGQLGVDVDPQGVGGRRLDELVIRQVGAEDSSGNYMSQKDLVFVMAIG